MFLRPETVRSRRPGTESLRTPDRWFADLPDFVFAPHSVDVDDGDGARLRGHDLDEGPRDAAPVLRKHAELSWSFQPAARTDDADRRHVDWTRAAVIDAVGLHDATSFGLDWDGLVGAGLVAEHADRFARVAAGSTKAAVGPAPRLPS